MAGKDERTPASPGPDPAWERLLDACLAGDTRAFHDLVDRKRELVHRVALHQVGDPEAAFAIAQDVFIRLWKNLRAYDRSRRFDTWLYQVTVNAAIDHHRRQARWRATVGLEEDALPPQAAATGAGRRSPASEMADDEVRRILLELATLLSEKQRLAFTLREIEGLTTSEVAEVMETTESTVRNHLFQARRVLAEALRERYPEYAPRNDGK